MEQIKRNLKLTAQAALENEYGFTNMDIYEDKYEINSTLLDSFISCLARWYYDNNTFDEYCLVEMEQITVEVVKHLDTLVLMTDHNDTDVSANTKITPIDIAFSVDNRVYKLYD